MNKKELKKELKRLQNRLEKELSISKYYEEMKNTNHSLYLNEKEYKEELEKRLDSINRVNKNKILNNFSDVFNDNYCRMNVFAEVQNICIMSIGVDSEQTDRAEHYAWFFTYIHGLLKKEASREFDKIEEQFEKQFQT